MMVALSKTKRLLFSLWAGIVSAEVVTVVQLSLSLTLITPDIVVAMNRSPEWQKSVGSIIGMLTPSLYNGLLLFGLVAITMWFFTGSANDRISKPNRTVGDLK